MITATVGDHNGHRWGTTHASHKAYIKWLAYCHRNYGLDFMRLFNVRVH